MKVRMFMTGVLLAGGVALVGAPIAAADDFAGQYAFQRGAGETAGPVSALWTVTPCGTDCRHIVTSSGATDTEAHLDGPYWVFDKFVDPGVECPASAYDMRKRKVPATMLFKINPDTLLGQYQPAGTPCGGVSPPTAFSLIKTIDGSPPPISADAGAVPSTGGAGADAHGGGH